MDTEKTTKMAGIVLAGGLSKRMGRNKATLFWHGTSLLDQQIDLLNHFVGKNSVFISGPQEYQQAIKDEEPGLGPVEGLLTILNHLERVGTFNSVILIPVDMPKLTVTDLELLENHLSTTDVVHFEGCSLPAAMQNLRKIKAEILRLKEQSRRKPETKFSFRNLYRHLSVSVIKHQEPERLMNINTIEDWQLATSTDYFREAYFSEQSKIETPE